MSDKKLIKENTDKLSKKKSTKVQIDPEDNKVVRFQRFVENNRKLVVSISIGIVAVTILFFVIRSWADKKSEENVKMASVALNRILDYYNQADYTKSLFGDSTKMIRGQKVIGLIEIIEEYDGTEQADIAKLYAGNCYLGMQKSQEAINYFDKALGSDSKMVQMGANAGMGAANEIAGNYKAAIENYDKAAELSENEEIKFRYIYFSGLCSEKIGDKKAAEGKFRQIVLESMYSEFSNFAKIGLTRLGTIIE
jgi:tetratricopeptide (TPR) repeat protein